MPKSCGVDDGMALESRIVGALPLLRQLCRDIGLAEVVDEMTQWDPNRCRLSPGRRIEALVLDVLHRRTPLYRVCRAYEDSALDVVFGEDIRPEDLTDDCLARALDKVAKAGAAKVYSAIALRACVVEQVDQGTVHADTTSISLHGLYPDAPDDGIRPAYGYSKDGHPELKQIVLAMICNGEGLPVWAETEDGNANDRKLHGERMVAELCQALSPDALRETTYVGDSALVTGPNLARLRQSGLRFISRIPESFAVTGQAKEAAWAADQWEDIGPLAAAPRPRSARYRLSEQRGEIDGQSYRLVVVHSDHLDDRKQKLLDRHLRQERLQMLQRLDAIHKERFACEEDAETAAGALMLEYDGTLHRLQVEVEPVVERLRRTRVGRPRADEPRPTSRQYRIVGHVLAPTSERLEAERQRRATFVLITNIDDPSTHSGRRVLEEYRNQHAVESRFRMLKDPMFVDALYLHTPRRIEALSYVLVMACLIYSIFERRVRRSLAERQETIELPGKRQSAAPTARALLLMLEGVTVARINEGAWQLAVPKSRRIYMDRLLHLAGCDLSVYAAPAHGPP